MMETKLGFAGTKQFLHRFVDVFIIYAFLPFQVTYVLLSSRITVQRRTSAI